MSQKKIEENKEIEKEEIDEKTQAQEVEEFIIEKNTEDSDNEKEESSNDDSEKNSEKEDEEDEDEERDIVDDSLFTFEHEGSVFCCDWNPKDKRLVATGGEDEKVRVFNVITKELILSIPEKGKIGESISIIKWSPDGNKIVFCAMNGTIQVWDITKKTKLSDLEGSDSELSFLEWDSTSRGLFGGDDSGLAWIWSASTGNCKLLSGHAAPVTCGCFGPDGQYALTGSEDRTICMWSIRTGEKTASFNAFQKSSSSKPKQADPMDAITCIASSPRFPHLIAFGKASGDLCFATYPNLTLSQTFKGLFNDAVNIIEFCRMDTSAAAGEKEKGRKDDSLSLIAVASLSDSGEVILIEAKQFRRRGQPLKHPAVVTAMHFHSTLPLLFTACCDGIVRLWDVRSGELLNSFTGHSDAVLCLSVCENIPRELCEEGAAKEKELQEKEEKELKEMKEAAGAAAEGEDAEAPSSSSVPSSSSDSSSTSPSSASASTSSSASPSSLPSAIAQKLVSSQFSQVLNGFGFISGSDDGTAKLFVMGEEEEEEDASTKK